MRQFTSQSQSIYTTEIYKNNKEVCLKCNETKIILCF